MCGCVGLLWLSGRSGCAVVSMCGCVDVWLSRSAVVVWVFWLCGGVVVCVWWCCFAGVFAVWVNLSGPDRCRPGIGPVPALMVQGLRMETEHRRRVLAPGDSVARARACCVIHQDGDIHLRWGIKPPYCLRRGLGDGVCQSLSSTAAHVDGSPQTSK